MNQRLGIVARLPESENIAAAPADKGRQCSGLLTSLGGDALWGGERGYRHVMLGKMHAKATTVTYAALDRNFGAVTDANRANDR